MQMFRRSETNPAPMSHANGFQPAPHPLRSASTSKSNGKAQAQPRFFTEVGGGNQSQAFEDEEARATPPPIKRSRGVPSSGMSNGLGNGYRPSSAGVGASKPFSAASFDQPSIGGGGHVRRGSATTNERETSGLGEERNAAAGGGKKWFGLSRNGSLRRS